MKIGIITFHCANNYGAVLQTYGTYRALSSLGHEVEVIDYRPRYLTEQYRLRLPTKISYIYHDIVGLLKQKQFDRFRSANLVLTPRVYHTWEELRKDPPKCDAYIAGSDQIWNPDLTGNHLDDAYFLDFGGSNIKRIAYAASFGSAWLDPAFDQEFFEKIRRLDAISMREETTQRKLQSELKMNVHWLPDPTLLVAKEAYEKMSIKAGNHKNIFAYNLLSGESIQKIELFVAKYLGTGITIPYSFSLLKRNFSSCFPGPEKWLGYICHAPFVVTNSFHGTVFSILFNKPFISVSLPGGMSRRNERVMSLLTRLNLQDRFLPEYNELKIKELLKRDIDWSAAKTRLDGWNAEAVQFLTRALT